MMKQRFLALLVAASVGAVLIGACGDDDDDNGNTGAGGGGGGGTGATADIGGESVDALGIWGSAEVTKFEAMVKPWEDETGASMNFTGSRDITAILTARVEGGNPPDIALPAEIGLFQDFAESGRLTPLSECDGLEEYITENYPDSFVELGKVDDTLYGFYMKADTKGTVWYDPKTFEERDMDPLEDDASFEDLLALSEKFKADGLAPWSIGVEAEGASGWPGSDWLQQIILNSDGGEELYDGIVDGSIPFTDPRVKAAWEQFGRVALTQGYVSQGGATGINATNFQDAVYPPFQDPAEAAMVYLGAFASTFITDQFPNAQPGTDYDFFTFPGGKVTGGANIVYAFNNDPATCSLLMHLASAEGQRIWVEAGGFTSVNEDVPMEAYPDAIAEKAAKQLLDAPAFRFDLDDAIGGATQEAIFAGVTQYLANPGQLDSILQSIQATRS
jgi:ABC-type glycerol-3-phosphate transport system substrate-binding protein